MLNFFTFALQPIKPTFCHQRCYLRVIGTAIELSNTFITSFSKIKEKIEVQTDTAIRLIKCLLR